MRRKINTSPFFGLYCVVVLVLSGDVSVASSENGCVGTKAYSSVAFSPDSKNLAAASEAKDGCFELWEISSKQRKSFLSSGGRIRSLIYSNDGNFLYLAKNDGEIAIWGTAERKSVGHLKGIGSPLTLDISDDDNYLAVGGASAIAKLINLRTKTLVLKLNKHSVVDSMDISPSGRYIALAQTYGVDLWDIKKGVIVHSFKDDESAFSVRFTLDEKRLVAAVSRMTEGDPNVRIWDLRDHSATLVPVGTSKQIVVTPDNEHIISGNTDGKVILIDLNNLSISRVFANAGGPITSLAISHDGRYIAAGTWNGLVKVWDLDSGKLLISNL